MPHRALTNLLCAMATQPGFSAEDRLLSVTTISFDIAALELYLPLVTGGCVEIAERELALDPRALAERLERATVFQATPATFRMLLESGWRGQRNLKVLMRRRSPAARARGARCGARWRACGTCTGPPRPPYGRRSTQYPARGRGDQHRPADRQHAHVRARRRARARAARRAAASSTSAATAWRAATTVVPI